MSATPPAISAELDSKVRAARELLDAHAVEIIQWHFHESTGCPFWLEKKSELKFDPLTEIKSCDDLKKFPPFEDEWLRGGPIRRWVPKGLADRPVFVFETGGTTGIPKSRMVIDDFRIDYELFSDTLPDEYFPQGSNWLMLGPSGPRRLRLAVEHLAQVREPHVRNAHPRGREPVARHVDGLEACGLDDAGGHGIVSSRHDEEPGALEQGSEGRGAVRHRPASQRSRPSTWPMP